MDWWVGVILVVLVLAAVLAYFEWKSRSRPLGRGIEGIHGGIHEQSSNLDLGTDPFGTRRALDKPRD